MLKTLARWLTESFFLSYGRKVYTQNEKNWLMPMSRWQKLAAGAYIILLDYSRGVFPPKFEDLNQAHQGEIDYYKSMPGVSWEHNVEAHMRKPFWGAVGYGKFSSGFQRLLELMESLGLAAGSRLLELGGGSGWMAEHLAHCGYDIVSSTIAPIDVEIGNKRAQSFKIKDLNQELRFVSSPMESIDKAVEKASFDGVFVFEALHHAFDWQRTFQAVYDCLKDHGWFMLCNEPNVMHTFISYRAAKLSHTHEIGFSRRQLVEELERCGYRKIKIIAPRWNNGITAHWIAAQK